MSMRSALSRAAQGALAVSAFLLSLPLKLLVHLWRGLMSLPSWFRTDAKFSWWFSGILSILPFVVVICLYLHKADDLRVQEQNRDGTTATASSKLMPLPEEIWDGFKKAAFEQDSKGTLRLVVDTKASFVRFGIGIGIVALGVIIGMYMGTFPIFEKLGNAFFTCVDLVPPMLVVVILFLLFDVGEVSKIALIVCGVMPGVIRDAYNRAKEIPREKFIAAQSLGASEAEIAWSVVLPRIMPTMIGTLRLNFKAAWSYVIAGEAFAASVGIGYRVFIMKRYVAMDTIMAYVIWATVIMFILDISFRWLESRYKWAQNKGV
jgi:NitT/TauT family transport system permease protein